MALCLGRRCLGCSGIAMEGAGVVAAGMSRYRISSTGFCIRIGTLVARSGIAESAYLDVARVVATVPQPRLKFISWEGVVRRASFTHSLAT